MLAKAANSFEFSQIRVVVHVCKNTYTVACFVYRITRLFSNIVWAMQCLSNCVSWFVSIILNLNCPFCGACIVQRHYAVSPKSDRKLRLLLEIILGNCLLMVSTQFEEHLWLYFVYFFHLRINSILDFCMQAFE